MSEPKPLRAALQTDSILGSTGVLAGIVLLLAVARARVPPFVAKRVAARRVVLARRGGWILVLELGDRLRLLVGERTGRAIGRELL